MHLTMCATCRRSLAFSDGASDKMKIMREGYKHHISLCKVKFGFYPKVSRWEL